MELVSTMEISGEEREIADAYAREQIAMNAQNIAANTEGIAGLNSNLDGLGYGDNGAKNLWNLDNRYTVTKNTFAIDKKPFKLNTGTYALSFDIDTSAEFTFYDSNKEAILSTHKKGAFTLSKECSYVSIWLNNGTIYNIQIEEGTTATPYEPYIPSVKMLAEEVNQQNESLSVIGKCKNLLNPILKTTTVNGVTCTNNGDGTYTFNGTATQDTNFDFFNDLKKYQHLKNRTVKLVGCPKGGSSTTYRMYLQLQKTPWTSAIDNGEGSSVTVDNNDNWSCWIRIYKDTTLSNLTFKPMITTDLSATYDDFVPYTGDGETLTHDVAELKNDLSATEEKIKSDDIQYEYYTKKSDGSVLASGVAASDSIRDAVSQMNNNMGVLLQAHNGLNEKVHFKDGITTNETLIGTFNGKNYYRKLFTGISASGSSITVNVGEKIEIYNYYGRAYTYGQSGASDVKYPIPNKNYYIDSQNASETSFQLTIPTSSDMRKIDLVIEYTKVDE